MRRLDDWKCAACGIRTEAITEDFAPPDDPCVCGARHWARMIPGPATTFKAAGRYIQPRRDKPG